MPDFLRRPWLVAFVAGATLIGIFVALVLQFRRELRAEIRETIIGRDAAVLYPVALNQIAEASGSSPEQRLAAVLRNARQRGMLAVALFGADGRAERAVPDEQLFVDLPLEDFLFLAAQRSPISRFHPAFALEQHFPGRPFTERVTPVLEVLLPLHLEGSSGLIGVARYHLDARELALELAAIDQRINRETTITLLIGAGLIAGVVTVASVGLRHAHRAVAERNERLLRANYELSLAAKASAIGQITSHLLHGLQGPVAGLRSALNTTTAGGPAGEPDWSALQHYSDRLQAMITETVRLLADATDHATYELDGEHLAGALRARNQGLAQHRGVNLVVSSSFTGRIDNHRGGLLCLIGNNLIENALQATASGLTVTVKLSAVLEGIRLEVHDEGTGVPEELRRNMFEPGRSGRPGGTGLGLAISRLLARQIGGRLDLCETGPEGSVFALTVPVTSA